MFHPVNLSACKSEVISNALLYTEIACQSEIKTVMYNMS